MKKWKERLPDEKCVTVSGVGWWHDKPVTVLRETGRHADGEPRYAVKFDNGAETEIRAQGLRDA